MHATSPTIIIIMIMIRIEEQMDKLIRDTK